MTVWLPIPDLYSTFFYFVTTMFAVALLEMLFCKLKADIT